MDLPSLNTVLYYHLKHTRSICLNYYYYRIVHVNAVNYIKDSYIVNCLSLQKEALHESTDIPQPSNRPATPDNQNWIFCKGEKVRFESDVSVAKKLQDDVGGWNDDMRNVNNRFLCSLLFIAVPVYPDFQREQ